MFYFLSLLFLLLSPSLYAQHAKPKNEKINAPQFPATDAAAGSLRPYTPQKSPYKGISKRSFYLYMRDSVALAIDLYLPKNLGKNDKIPALLRQTRYWRSPQLRFPLNLFSKGLLGRTGKMIREIVEQGYAVVNVDVRGSGASFGKQNYPWNPDEVQDGYEILTWMAAQPWCNGNLGAIGVSYDGTAAEFLAATQHPNLKAVVLMFSLFDVYEDNAFPGGMHHEWFTRNWGEANTRMDRNQLPANYRKLKPIVKGVSKVKTKKRNKILKQAIAQHSDNRNVHDGAMSIDCRNDQPSDSLQPPVDVFSPHRVVDSLAQSQVAVYSYTGWHDGGYQHAAIKRQLNLPQGKGHKILIGPWEHGGKFNISPFVYNQAAFNHKNEILKFFDFHLKGIQNGLDQEPPIHVFTLGSEQWLGLENWPPSSDLGYENQTFILNKNNQLSKKQAQYFVDSLWENHQFGTGDLTRWKALNGKVQQPFTYWDWTERSAPLLHYVGPIFEQDYELTGHPIVHLHASFSACEGALFAYLEDLSPEGKVRQITEGMLRASHRKINPQRLYADAVPSPSYRWEDRQFMEENEWVEMQFDLLPISYTLKKGHRLRLSIAGGDKDHFEQLNPQGYWLRIRSDAENPSYLKLPLKAKGLSN